MKKDTTPAGPGVVSTADREVFEVPDATGKAMVEGGYAVEVGGEKVEPKAKPKAAPNKVSKGKAAGKAKR